MGNMSRLLHGEPVVSQHFVNRVNQRFHDLVQETEGANTVDDGVSEWPALREREMMRGIVKTLCSQGRYPSRHVVLNRAELYLDPASSAVFAEEAARTTLQETELQIN